MISALNRYPNHYIVLDSHFTVRVPFCYLTYMLNSILF